MTPYYTSMHLDRRNHQPMEIESIIGEPLRRGRQKNIDMPETEKLYEGLTALDRDNHK
jgi:ketopantoate reductase